MPDEPIKAQNELSNDETSNDEINAVGKRTEEQLSTEKLDNTNR